MGSIWWSSDDSLRPQVTRDRTEKRSLYGDKWKHDKIIKVSNFIDEILNFLGNRGNLQVRLPLCKRL